MANAKKLSAALTPKMAAEPHAAVEAGDYGSVSEVVRDGLRDWRLRRKIEALETDFLRRPIQEGIDSGPGQEAGAVFARLNQQSPTVPPTACSFPHARRRLWRKSPTTSPATTQPGPPVSSTNWKPSASRPPRPQTSIPRPSNKHRASAWPSTGAISSFSAAPLPKRRSASSVSYTAPQPAPPVLTLLRGPPRPPRPPW
jgi:antitoxin ParD1/3/4